MPESLSHANLVRAIVGWVRARHEINRGLSLVYESTESPPGRRPWAIGSFVPDVIAQTFPASFFLIGEAKTTSDLMVPHTRHQIEAYVRWLATKNNSILVLATPLYGVGFAKSLARQTLIKCDAPHIQLVFLADCGQDRILNC